MPRMNDSEHPDQKLRSRNAVRSTIGLRAVVTRQKKAIAPTADTIVA